MFKLDCIDIKATPRGILIYIYDSFLEDGSKKLVSLELCEDVSELKSYLKTL